MNSGKLYKLLIIAGFILVTTTMSCEKDLEKSNPNSVTIDKYFKNSDELQRGANGIYSMLRSGSLIGREWFFLHDLRSDDVATGGGQLEVPRAQILNGAVAPDNPVMSNVWSGLYTTVHRANTVIDNAPNVTDNNTLRDRLVLEAKFLRGFAYFELVTLWGPVPLYTTQVTLPDQFQPRVAEDLIYTQIISDLTEAEALPASYSDGDIGRVTSGAASAMLGRVLIQKGDYAGAKTALLKVYGKYSLVNEYADNFDEEHEFNAESIMEVGYVIRSGETDFNWGYVGDGAGAPATTVRNQEYSPIAWRNLIPSNKLLNEFESVATGATKNDPRFVKSVYQTGDKYNNGTETLTDAAQNGNSSVVNGVTKKISWRKFMRIYKSNSGFEPGGINQRIMRYADVLLMLAECENELGNTAAAVNYLNEVRDRPSVAMPHYPTAQFPTGTKDQVTKAIMHERTVELGDEEVRNRDILRWRKKGYFTGGDPLSYFRANRDELLPIPSGEINNNPSLGDAGISAQNQGY